MSDITLNASMRASLVAMQNTTNLLDRTGERLGTGKKVNSALDNPSNYFAAQAHESRANQLNGRKDGMNEAIETLKAADKGVKALSSLVENLRGVISAARSSATGATVEQKAQYDAIKAQMDSLAGDSGYKGTNLLGGSAATPPSLKVVFNESGSSSLTLASMNVASSTIASSLAVGDGIGAQAAALDTLETNLNTYLSTMQSNAANLSSNLSIIQARASFTTDMVNVLSEGANNLTAADMNEESANMLALQTRQQLATSSLSIASQAAQGVLRLF